MVGEVESDQDQVLMRLNRTSLEELEALSALVHRLPDELEAVSTGAVTPGLVASWKATSPLTDNERSAVMAAAKVLSALDARLSKVLKAKRDLKAQEYYEIQQEQREKRRAIVAELRLLVLVADSFDGWLDLLYMWAWRLDQGSESAEYADLNVMQMVDKLLSAMDLAAEQKRRIGRPLHACEPLASFFEDARLRFFAGIEAEIAIREPIDKQAARISALIVDRRNYMFDRFKSEFGAALIALEDIFRSDDGFDDCADLEIDITEMVIGNTKF